jgi:Transposase IS116/IS110/IS902 family
MDGVRPIGVRSHRASLVEETAQPTYRCRSRPREIRPVIGVLLAAKFIGEIAGVGRFGSDAQLARLAGCAPIPVSSGRTDRHRLDPGGNRQLNHAFHLLAVVKIRHDPPAAVYIAKQRAAGRTNKEAIRCLKRQRVRRVYHLLKDPNSIATTVCLTSEPSWKGKPDGADSRYGLFCAGVGGVVSRRSVRRALRVLLELGGYGEAGRP